MRRIQNVSLTGAMLLAQNYCHGFVYPRISTSNMAPFLSSSKMSLSARGSGTEAPPDTGFIATELRGAAMRLHTREQAPKEGERKAPVQAEPYVTTHMDYLTFLVDSRHVYATLEEIVEEYDELSVFRNTGLERVKGLDIDIDWMASEYNLEKPEVGASGLNYAKHLKEIAKHSIPAFMCHYYNYYFAHTAGGRMIGLKMASLLLNKKTLEFYKWDDLNAIKAKVKGDIEAMADLWTREEKDACVNETMGAFAGGGALNGYLSGGPSAH